MNDRIQKIDILGTEYTIRFTTEKEDSRLHDCNGCCDFTTKEILIETNIPRDEHTVGSLDELIEVTLRHEIIHAFLSESGLWTNCYWAVNEEVVDWIAIQFPKLSRVFSQVQGKDSLYKDFVELAKDTRGE